MKPHLIFFDGSCALCITSIRSLMKIDRKHRLLFAPLDGLTAGKLLTDGNASLRGQNTLILFENYRQPTQRIWTRGRAVFRILWLLGGKWKPLGALCFLPFGIDWLYKRIAHHRHHLATTQAPLPPNDPRLLP